MKISCLNTDFLNAINAASKASSTNTSFPILETLLIEAEDEIKITGNNLEIAIEYSIPGNIMKQGMAAVDSKMICEIMRRMPDGVVTFECTENNIMTINCGELVYNINTIPGEDFPKIPDITYMEKINVNCADITTLVRKTSFAVAQNDLKPILTGVKFEFKKDEIRAISVDGFRLALKTVKTKTENPEFSCVIPGKSLNELCKITGATETMEISVSDKNVLFTFDGCKFFSRILEGEFINYEAFIPKEGLYDAEVNLSEFLKCIDRASLLSESDGSKTPVKITYDNDLISVACSTERGKMSDSLIVTSHSDQSFVVGYNCKYLMDSLKAADGEKVLIRITGDKKPTVIKPIDGDDFIFIVLPVMIR